MGKKIIVLDPGHGMGNLSRRDFDPGACRYATNGNGKRALVAREASVALDYAVALGILLQGCGYKVLLTRYDQREPASLAHRLQFARQNGAAALISLHLNADPDPDGPKDPQARGHEVLYRHPGSEALARAISQSLTPLIPAHGAGVVQPSRVLTVLKYEPRSVLVELGFIDSDADFALLSDPEWKVKACEAMADAIQSQVPSPKSQVQSQPEAQP